jgi:hypothetical protein
VIVIVAVCLVVTVAAIAYAAGKTSNDVPEVIRAGRFVLVDSQGTGRAALRMAGDSPGLVLSDAKGTTRVRLQMRSDDTPSLSLFNENGTQSARLSVDVGSPTLSLNDEKGSPRAILGLIQDGSTAVFLWDDKGVARAGLWLHSTDGAPAVTLWDSEGGLRAALGAVEPNVTHPMVTEKRPESSLTLFNEDAEVLWQAP